MIGVGAHAVAHDLRQDPGAARTGQFQLLENKNTRAFAHDESVTVTVPRTGCALWIIIARGERPHGSESADSHRRYYRFGAPADHRVSLAVSDEAERVADGVRAGGAGRGGRRVWSLGAAAHRNVS